GHARSPKVKPLHATLARRALLRLDSMAAPDPHSLGVPRPQFPRLCPACLPRYSLQTILRRVLVICASTSCCAPKPKAGCTGGAPCPSGDLCTSKPGGPMSYGTLFAAVHKSAYDAVDGSSTGTEVPWMWVLLRPPRFGGAT